MSQKVPQLTVTIDEYRKILNLMEGNNILVSWDNSNDEKYEIKILNNQFEVNSNVFWNMLGFYLGTSIKLILPNTSKENSAIIKIPKLWHKNKDIGKFLKERHIASSAYNYPIDIFGINNINFGGVYASEYYWHMEEKINEIMRKQYENMRILYFSHPMLTYYPRHPIFEKRCYEIIEREIGNKLPNKIKIESIINPNSEQYIWKKEGEEENIHESEWDSGFTWEKFGNSMTWYCRLVEKSDGVIWSPIFEYNTRKNAKKKFLRLIKRGVKTEISYATKLGIPMITFSNPEIVNGYYLPTDIELPYYMYDNFHGKIENNKIICNKTRKIIGNIDINFDFIERNGKIITIKKGLKRTKKFYNYRCDKCHLNGYCIEDLIKENILKHSQHCTGDLSYNESLHEESDISKLFNEKEENVGWISRDLREIYWTEYNGQPCLSYNRDENIYRYSSPFPFHIYINNMTRQIHERPKGYDSTGGRLDVFEPWDGLPISNQQKEILRKLGMKEKEIADLRLSSDSRKTADEIINSLKLREKHIIPKTNYYTHDINIDNIDDNSIKFNDEGYNDLGLITCNIDDATKNVLLLLQDIIKKYKPGFKIYLSDCGNVIIEPQENVKKYQKDILYKLGMSKNDIDNIKFYEQAKQIIDNANKDDVHIRSGCKYNPHGVIYESRQFKFYEGYSPTYCFIYYNELDFNNIALRYNELQEMVKKGCEIYLSEEHRLIAETRDKSTCIVSCPKCGRSKTFDNVVPIAWTKDEISEDRITKEIINKPHNDPNGNICASKPNIEFRTKKILF